MAYGVVFTTNILNAKTLSFQSAEDLENGFFVTKGDLVAGETEIYEAVKPVTADFHRKAYLVSMPAVNYDDSRPSNQNEENFINVAGTPFRVYDFEANDKFKVTDYTLDGAVAEGNYVTLADDSYKLNASATVVFRDFGFIGKIERIEDMGYFYYVGQLGKDSILGVPGVDGRVKMVTISIIKNDN